MKILVTGAIPYLMLGAGWLLGQDATPPPQIEAYDSWKLAKKGAPEAVVSPATIFAPEGFSVDLLRAAREDEDSWVGMCFDDRGRLYVAKEDRGILRMTFSGTGEVGSIEVVNDFLEECRGLLWAHDSLYANANDSKGFFRLRDTDGDDRFDNVQLLLASGGGVGHGRNHLRLGPDKKIYLVHGNDVALNHPPTPDSPYQNYAEDQLIPNPWDDEWFNNRAYTPAGHILRTDKDGSSFELIAGGLRNPLDIDFNRDGEPFVYEADMEWETGLAWYRPTRVLHIVSGGEYGWRRGTGKFPVTYSDSLPPAHDVGLGSPTGVEFGYRSNWPEKYREAFFIADWAYGRILAVHLRPDGASYRAGTDGFVPEPGMEHFVSGRPLNVTDFTFGPDGAMYFITGGRRTQSVLYRVRWTGKPVKQSVPKPDPAAEKLSALRRKLESFHTQQSDEGVNLALSHLGHSDRFIRFAARLALENQPPEAWQEIVLATHPPAGLLALARVGDSDADRPRLLKTLGQNFPPNHRRFENITRAIKEGSAVDPILLEGTEQTLLDQLRALQITLIRMGEPEPEEQEALIEQLNPAYPSMSSRVNHELCELLVYLGAPGVIDRTLNLLEASTDTRDHSQYLVFLRYLEDSWTTDQRRRYLEGLQRFERTPGGRWYVRTAEHLRKEVVTALTEAQKTELADLLPAAKPDLPPPAINLDPAKFVKAWTMADFAEDLKKPLNGRSRKSGEAAFNAAACVACHTMDGNENSKISVLGPDLSAVGARFGPGDLLESIIHPSHVIGEKYRNQAGPNISTMPPGLINVLEKERVLDLLAYLQAGGSKSPKP